MTPNMQNLFDSLDEGLLMVSTEGVVRLANQAAMRLFPVIVGQPLAMEEIQVQLSAAHRGYVRLPVEFEIDAPRQRAMQDRLRVRLMLSPVGGGFLLVVHNQTEARRFDTVLNNLASLMAVEVAEPLATAAHRLARLLVDLVPDMAAREVLSEELQVILLEGGELCNRLSQLATYAQVFDRAPLLSSERIQVTDLITQLLHRVQPMLDRNKIKIHLAATTAEMPVVYGSRDWLVEALNGYIEYAVKHCRVHSDIELAVQPHGNFVHIVIRNRGRALPKHVRERSFMPFYRPGQGSPGREPPPSIGLGLPLCRRIVELHQGNLRMAEEDGEVMSVELELPTGAPAERAQANLDLAQARRYAEDLTRLMQRQRTPAVNGN